MTSWQVCWWCSWYPQALSRSKAFCSYFDDYLFYNVDVVTWFLTIIGYFVKKFVMVLASELVFSGCDETESATRAL